MYDFKVLVSQSQDSQQESQSSIDENQFLAPAIKKYPVKSKQANDKLMVSTIREFIMDQKENDNQDVI